MQLLDLVDDLTQHLRTRIFVAPNSMHLSTLRNRKHFDLVSADRRRTFEMLFASDAAPGEARCGGNG
jgi:hypothetical protein